MHVCKYFKICHLYIGKGGSEVEQRVDKQKDGGSSPTCAQGLILESENPPENSGGILNAQ